MTGYLITAGGEKIQLPPFTRWQLTRTGSVPCDSFEAVCPWDGGVDRAWDGACRLAADENGQRRFTGVLDEYEMTWGERGGELSLSGRGLAALLVDNEARGQDYPIATIQDILREHVEPYGLELGKVAALPPVPGFTVSSGSSEWAVLYDFAWYHGGVRPWFDAFGKVSVNPDVGCLRTADDRDGITAVAWRDRRYGVYSEVLVQDRGKLAPQRVVNESFSAQGGRCRRVITMPRKSAYQAMRYSGQFQLDQSVQERFQLELTFPGSYVCEPGDWMSVSLRRPALAGTWRVKETRASMSERGCQVKVILGGTQLK